MTRWKLKTIICKICQELFDAYLIKTSICTKCQDKINNKKYYKKNKLKYKEQSKKWRKENPKKYKQNNKKYYKEHQDKMKKQSLERYYKTTKSTPKELTRKDLKDWTTSVYIDIKKTARLLLQRAVNKKRIIKSTKCEKCKYEFPKHKIHGHHTNYNEWWNVVWLCEKCHKQLHIEINKRNKAKEA